MAYSGGLMGVLPTELAEARGDEAAAKTAARERREAERVITDWEDKTRRLSHVLALLTLNTSEMTTEKQGVYQSNQSTAAAVQVNNINLILGRIGRPGCGVLQMNGQPTAQNTRDTGANGDLRGFRNWENPTHIDELARIWNVDPAIIPHWGPPRHALQIFRYCEIGSIRMLWIQATNPAVSLPDLGRVRSILQNPDLFIVVQDAFPTETTSLPMSSCQSHYGARRQGLSPMPTAQCISATRRSTHQARRAPISTFLSTSPGAWISGTRTARR